MFGSTFGQIPKRRSDGWNPPSGGGPAQLTNALSSPIQSAFSNSNGMGHIFTNGNASSPAPSGQFNGPSNLSVSAPQPYQPQVMNQAPYQPFQQMSQPQNTMPLGFGMSMGGYSPYQQQGFYRSPMQQSYTPFQGMFGGSMGALSSIIPLLQSMFSRGMYGGI